MIARLCMPLVVLLVLGAAAGPAVAERGPVSPCTGAPAEVHGRVDHDVPRDVSHHPRPFPLASLDPYDCLVGSPSQSWGELERSLGWQPINWKINSDLTTQIQNEEQVVVNPLNHDNLVAVWRDFRLGYRRVGVGYSFDGGLTWHDSLLVEPTYSRQSDPGLTFDRFGNIYAVVLSYTGNTSQPNGLFIFKSGDGGVTWGDPVAVVNGVSGVFEDKELIACDRSGGIHDGNLYVPWARFGWSVDIMCARSTDGGSSFQSPVGVSDNDSVQWPCPAVGPDGTVYVAWAQYWPSSVRIDRSFDGGASFGNDITVSATYTAQTEINGGILVFSFPAVDCDMTGGAYAGRVYIAYMDRGGADYDIFMRYSDDRGATWSAPVRVNDDPYGNGCDQFHQWTYVSDDGVVNVVFYDRRNDPSNFLMDVYLAQSFDGGATFDPNVRVTTVSSDPTAGDLRAGLIGEYIGLAAPSSSRVHPVWTDTREGNQDVYTAIVDTTFVAVPGEPQVAALRLFPPIPNPFGSSTRLSYTAGGAGAVDLEVFDIAGRKVRGFRSTTSGGGGSFVWDGCDQAGENVASGVYFARVSSGSGVDVAKVILMR